MTTYKVTIKEVMSDHLVYTSITTDKDLNYVCEFFGLKEPDVEWCTIEKEQ